MSLRNLRHLRSFSPLLQKAASHPPKAVFSRHWRQSGGGRGRGPLGDKDGGRRNIIAIWSQGVDKLGRAKPVKTSGRASDDKVEENQQEEKTGSGDSSFPRKDQEEEEEEEGRRKEKEISPTQDGSEGGEKEVRVEEVKVRVEAKAREKAGERITYKKFRISHHEIHPKAREERGEAAGAERRGGGPSSPSHRSYESGGYYELSPDDPMRDPMKGNLAGMTIERLSFIPAQKLKKKADEAPPKAGIVDVKASSSSSPPGKERNGEKSPILDGRGWVTEEDFVQPSASPYEIHDSVALPEEDADAGKKSPRARTSPGPQTLRGIKRRHQEGPRGKYGIDNQPILQAEWPKAPPKGTDYVEPQASFSQKSEAKEGTEGESGSGDGKEGDGTRWEDKAMQERRKEGFDVTRVSGEPSGASDNKEDHLEKQLGKGGAGVTSKLEDLGLTQSRKDLAGVKEYDEEEPIGGDKPTKLLPHEQATRGSNFAGGRPDLRVTDSGTEGAETERSSHLHPEFNAPIRAAQRAKEALERLNPWKRRDARKEDARRQSDWQDAVKESPESRVLPPESSSDRKTGRDKTAADSEFSPTWPKMKKKHEGEKQKDNGLVHLKGPSMAYRDELRQASAEEEDSLATPKEYDFRLKVEAVPTEHKRADLNNAKKTKKNHSEGSASTDASHVFEELRELEKAIDNVLKKVKASHTASSARPRGGDPGDKGSKSSSSSSGGDCCGDSVTQNDVCHDFGHEGPQKHHSVEAKPPILTSPTLQASLEPPVVPPQKEIKFDRIEKAKQNPICMSINIYESYGLYLQQSEDEGFDRPPFAALEEDVLSESVRDAVSTPHQKEKGKEVEQLEESAWRRLWSGWGMKLTFSNPFVAMGDPAEATVKKSDQIPVAVTTKGKESN